MLNNAQKEFVVKKIKKYDESLKSLNEQPEGINWDHFNLGFLSLGFILASGNIPGNEASLLFLLLGKIALAGGIIYEARKAIVSIVEAISKKAKIEINKEQLNNLLEIDKLSEIQPEETGMTR